MWAGFHLKRWLPMLILWLCGTTGVYPQTSEPRALFQKRFGIAGVPQDWHRWWQTVADSTHLIEVLPLPEGPVATYVLLVNRVVDNRNPRAEGNEQWLFKVALRADTLELQASHRIGFFYCCGGAWVHAPQLHLNDANQDGHPEVVLQGRYEHSSDSHYLEGQAEIFVFLNSEDSVSPARSCLFPPPGFFLQRNILPVIRQGIYKYFGPPRLDVAPFNRVEGRLVPAEASPDSGRPGVLVRQHTWFLPARSEEIHRWYETGDPEAFSEFQKQVRREELFWNAKTGRLEAVCPPNTRSFKIRQRSAHELIVQQDGFDVWFLYFDEPVLHVAPHPTLPLAAVFTTRDSGLTIHPHPAATSALYLVNLWAGEQVWVELPDLPPERWFFQIWSPKGTYALLPDPFSSDWLLFRSSAILTDETVIRYSWLDEPWQHISAPVDMGRTGPASGGQIPIWHSDTELDLDVRTPTALRKYRYDIRAQKWSVLN